MNLYPSKRKSRDSQNYFGILVYLFRFQKFINEIIRPRLRLVSGSFYEISRLFLLNPAQNHCHNVSSPERLSNIYPGKAGFLRTDGFTPTHVQEWKTDSRKWPSES